jgi:hypothetical protein
MSTIDLRGAIVNAADPPIGTNPNPDLAIKAPVRAATTGSNITLSGLFTLDGVALAAGDRVLVKDQTDATTNGLYNAATGPWTRTIDANNNSQFTQGALVLVTQGSANLNSTFELTAANPIALGTSALTYIVNGRPATRNINTAAPLAGGGPLSSDLTLSLTFGGTLAVVGNALQTVAGTGDVTWSANSFATTIANAAVGNAKLANMAAWTIKGNATGGSAAPSDFTIDGLTLKASPAASDEVIIWDVAASAIKKATISSVGSSSGVTSLLGLTGAIGNQWGLATTGSNIGIATTNPPFPVDCAINLQLNCSVASNLLTVAIKGNNGSDPSATNPVLIPFRDTTQANGDPIWLAVTSALSINTNATGATLGSSSGTPFRFWVVAFNNGGAAVLALINCSTTSQIFPLASHTLQSTTAISASAASAGIFYTPNGTALTSKAFCILGYLEYSSGLTTAGTYGVAPTNVQLFGPGIKKPGDVVQVNQKFLNTTFTSTTSGALTDVTGMSLTITPTSAANLVMIDFTTNVAGDSGAGTTAIALLRGSTNIACGAASGSQTQAAGGITRTSDPVSINTISNRYLDAPGTASSTTYKLQFYLQSGTFYLNRTASDANAAQAPRFGSSIIVTELMG